MANIPPIEDAYIDSIIKSAGAYQPSLLKTQGVKLRELLKLFRDRFEQEVTTINENEQHLTFGNGLKLEGDQVELGGDYTGEIRIGGTAENPVFLLGNNGSGSTYTSLNINGSDYSAGVQSSRHDDKLTSSLFLLKNLIEASLKIEDNGDFKMLVTDQIANRGLEEAGDYSANKTQYSYITKKMLDSAISALSAVAISGKYSDLSGKPTNLSEFANDLGNYGSFAKSDGTNVTGTWNLNVSGNAATATTSGNAGKWGGLDGQYLLTGGIQSDGLSTLTGVHSNGFAYQFNTDAVKNFLSLGSFAYRNSINGSEIVSGYNQPPSTDIGTAQTLRWKNYGNNHVIFDASQGTSPSGTHIDNANPEFNWEGTYPTLMGWNGTNTYGVRVQRSAAADRADYMQTINSAGIHLVYGNAAPTISLAIGDHDTGFHALSDGSTAYYSNGVRLFNLNSSADMASFTGLNNGSTLSNNITGNAGTAGSAGSAGYAGYLSCPDGSRNPDTFLPQDNPNRVRFDFTSAPVTGTGGNYSGTMTFSPWTGTTASTGDASYQLVFGSSAINGNGTPMLRIRKGIDATWNQFYDVWTTANMSSASVEAAGSTLVQRDVNGYIYASYVNSNRPLENTGAQAYIYDTGDGWMRKKTAMNASIELFNQHRHWQLHNYDSGVGYNNGTLELMNSVTRPVLGFHWEGVVASTISIEASGRIAIMNNPGTGYEDLVARAISSTSQVSSGTGTDGGFTNGAYNAGHNNIWRLGNATEYGFGYYQGGTDYIGFHFGDRNNPQFRVTASRVYATNFEAANDVIAPHIYAQDFLAGGRVYAGYDSGVAGSVSCNGWFRSQGATGWYNQDFGGGIYMTDGTWVRTHGSKGFLVEGGIGIQVEGGGQIRNNGNGFKSFNNLGMVGDYDQTGATEKIIWTIGDGWNSLGSMYGMNYSYSGKYGGGHQIQFRSGGVPHAAIDLDAGNAFFDGSVSAGGGFYDTSDVRLKTLTKQKFDTRSVKTYTYYKNEKLQTGYLAQDVEEVLPHAVSSNGEYLTLNYNQVLVNKISNLEEDLAAANQEIQSLKLQLEKVMSHLNLN